MLNKKTLLTRALTAIIFGVIVIILLNFSRITVLIFLTIVALATAFEYLKIKSDGKTSMRDLLIVPVLFGAGPLVVEYFTAKLTNSGFLILLILMLIYDFYLIFRLFTYNINKTKGNVLIYFEILFYIGIPLLLLVNLFLVPADSFSIAIFILILMIWTNDTFAYLTGSMLGKNKLMPKVSPGKTIEGFVGGGVFTIIISVLLFNYYDTYPLYFYIVLAIIVWILGTIGDLIESLLKRSYGIKDSGKIMPGHGGFLDRFDSFLFSVPFMILLTYILMKFI